MALITDLSGLADAITNNTLAEVDSVTIEIPSPLVITEKQGYGIWGRSAGWLWNSAQAGVRTLFKYTGATDLTAAMITFDGMLEGTLQNCAFDCDSKLGYGVRFKSKEGFGTGRFHLQNLNFRNATEAAILCGSHTYDGTLDNNTADLTYTHCGFLHCGAALRTNNHQSVNHTFINPQILACTKGWNMEKGGNLQVIGGGVAGVDKMLVVGYGGPNAGTYNLMGTRVELNGRYNQYGQLVYAVDCPDTVMITMDSLQETQYTPTEGGIDNSNDPVFHIGNNVALNLTGHRHRQRSVIAQVEDDAVFTDHLGRWWTSPGIRTAWVVKAGDGRVYVTDPRDSAGRQIPGWIFD